MIYLYIYICIYMYVLIYSFYSYILNEIVWNRKMNNYNNIQVKN